MSDDDLLAQHRDDSAVRWAEHGRDHDKIEAQMKSNHDDLVLIKGRLDSGNEAFSQLREVQARHAEEIEALKPQRWGWIRVAATVGGLAGVIAGSVWFARGVLEERPTVEQVEEKIRPIEHEATTTKDRLQDLQIQQSATRATLEATRADVVEIKTDLKTLLRRGR